MTQRAHVTSSKAGYTLIEVLIALVILAIVSLALMKSSLLVIQKNQQNELRDEAVRIAEQTMNAIRFSPLGFDVASASGDHLNLFVEDYPLPDPVTRTIRGGTVQYAIRKTVIALGDGNNKQVTVTVSWSFQNQPASHSVVSIVGRPAT